MSTATEKTIESVDNLVVHYQQTWDQEMDGGWVVLHPGSSMDGRFLEQLSYEMNQRHHPTIVLDPRGTGASAAPAKSEYYPLDRYADDLARIVAQEGLEYPVLVGHSMGFMPIVDYAAQTYNAEMVLGICASHNFRETSGSRWLPLLDSTPARYAMELYGYVANRFGSRSSEDRLSSPRSEYDVFLAITDVPLGQLKNHVVSGQEIMKWDIAKQLEQLIAQCIPVSALQAGDDALVREDRSILSCLGVSVVRYEEGPHALPLIHPDSAAAWISDQMMVQRIHR